MENTGGSGEVKPALSPKETKTPNGIAKTSVQKKTFNVIQVPAKRAGIISLI